MSADRGDRARKRSAAVRAGSCALLCSSTLSTPVETAQLPVPCAGSSCGPQVTTWVSSGQATAVAVGNSLTVTQSSDHAILNWSSFNVSADGKVVFNQPGASSIALNRIFQASPSEIFGTVQANGQIYLINQNGFLFGSTAKVNVGGLLVSTLNISDSTFANGLLSPITHAQAAATSDGRTGVLDAAGNVVLGPDGKPVPVQIQIQSGASIVTQDAGERLMFAGQAITNAGSLSAPDGQVVLAAGQKLYLTGSSDPNLRGLVVEVDGGGPVTNAITGSVSSDRGNVTLVGLAVNQQGRVSATTSIAANGSIYLLARDTVAITSPNGSFVPTPTHGGTLTLGPSSVTSVLPDTSSAATAVDDQPQPQSTLRFDGQQLEFSGGSQVIAPDGQLTVTANSDPDRSGLTAFKSDPGAQLRIDSGALIDLSGSTASVPVTRNLVTVQLRANELADSPLQRDGPLRGATVVVDARVGTPLANVSGEIALTQRGVLERTSNGGTATFDSLGDVVLAPGATINVSGGQVDYTPGLMQTTELVKSDGTLVDIGHASPLLSYQGILNPTFKSVFNQWGVTEIVPTPGIAHYDPGYVEGKSAGSVSFLASSMVLSGNLEGHALNGPYQRSTNLAVGGLLTIGAPGATDGDFRAPGVQFVIDAPPTIVAEQTPLPANLPVSLPTAFLTSGGFSGVTVASNGQITIGRNVSLDLPQGGTVSLTAPSIVDQGSIVAHGGAVTLNALASGLSAGYGILLGGGADIDVSGEWINDFLVPPGNLPTGVALINGGSITLNQQTVGTLELDAGVGLHASGGAWATQSGSLTGGAGGSLSILGGSVGTLKLADGIAIDGFGVQGASGGSLTLLAPRMAISSGDSTWLRAQTVGNDPTGSDALELDSSVFPSFGFARFTLRADEPTAPGSAGNILTVAPDTSIDLRTRTVLLGSAALAAPSGGSAVALGLPQLLPDFQRGAASLTLQAASAPLLPGQGYGDLVVGAGSVISGDPGSSIALASTGSLQFDGRITAHAGSVAMSIGTPPINDPGYLPNQRIDLGSGAAIDVSGVTRYTPNDAGELTGAVLPGGSVTLTALRGSVVTEVGSIIDVSGTQAPVDLPSGTSSPPVRSTVASAAGSVSVQAAESVSLLGGLIGQAGAGDTGSAPGGSLSVTLTRLASGINAQELQSFPQTPRTVVLEGDDGGQLQSPASGIAAIATDRLASSGFDALTVAADDQVLFQPFTQLSLARSFTAQTPVLTVMAGGAAGVSAPYITLGTGRTTASAAQAVGGTGSLSFSGEAIDLVGYTAFQGVGQATLSSSGDLVLQGTAQASGNVGSLAIAGDLNLSAARIWPATGVGFTINAAGGTDNTVKITSSGASGGTPLSVAGSLTINADDIEQSGTLLAPFGTIALNATKTLNLTGGLVSVAGDGATLPYGRVDNGTSWVYALNPTNALAAPTAITAVPNRSVSLTAPNVTIAAGATVDVSGGGDLLGYQWTPGTGGTKDVLAPGVTAGLYAIVPSLTGSSAAPYDPMLWAQSGLQPGASVYLSGGGGLAAGTYLLLPARYGLLPGAYLISRDPGFSDLVPGTAATATDGSVVVAGKFTFADTGLGDTRFSGFDVHPGNSYANTLATYGNNLASAFFAPGAPTATAGGSQTIDGGTLALAVTDSLSALGSVLASAADRKGEGAQVEIEAPALEIDPSVSAATARPNGVVTIGADTLHAWAPGRLLLGGLLSGPETVTVGTNVVHFTPGASVSADEVIVAARQAIIVDAGATVASSSLASGVAPSSARFDTPTTLSLQGTGAGQAAVLAVSDLADLVVARPTASGAPLASIALAAGATVGSRGAIVADSPGVASIADSAIAGAGGRWTLGAAHIVFGPGDAAPDGMAIDPGLLSAINGAGVVRLLSGGAIDLLEPVVLGGSASQTLSSLTLQGASLNNLVAGAVQSFSASQLTLDGASGAAVSGSAAGGLPATTGSGSTLQIGGREIDVGSGALTLSGFDDINLNATGGVVGTSNVQLTASSGNVVITAPIVTVNANALAELLVPNGTLTLAAATSPAQSPALAVQSGGAFAASAQSITENGVLVLPSGRVELSTQGDLTIGGMISTAGITPTGAAHGSFGGQILLSAGGDLTVQSAATLDVSSGTGAPAGQIALTAGGTAALAGTLTALDAASTSGGVFEVRAGTLTDFVGLNRRLEQGGFTQERDFEVTSGSLLLPASEQLTAQHVALLADAGSVTIAGTVDASAGGGNRGSIEIAGRDGVAIAASGRLLASALDATTSGGTIELSASQGSVSIAAGATLAATGLGSSGRLTLRAPVSASGTDVAIDAQGVDFTRVDALLLEPWLSYTLPSGAPTADDFSAVNAQAATAVAALTPGLTARLGNPPNAIIQPFIDMTFQGDVTLPSVDFSSAADDPWRFNGAPADIAIRATGNVTVNGTLSDGFTSVAGFPPSTNSLDLLTDLSSSIRLVAGADLGAASVNAVLPAGSASLTLDPGAIVRTGTGDLRLIAAGNVVFGKGASVYTGGLPATDTVFNPARSAAGDRITVAQSFPMQGGSVLVSAGQGIVAAPVTSSVGDWQERTYADGDLTTAGWGVDFQHFAWTVGALGGGNVSLRAGANITDVAAATADARYQDPDSGDFVQVGTGGNMTLAAGGDIGSALLYVASGTGRLSAGGSLSQTRFGPKGAGIGTLLLADDASYSIAARGDVLLEGEVGASALNPGSTRPTGLPPSTYYYRYGGDSLLQVSSAGGSISLTPTASDPQLPLVLGAYAAVSPTDVLSLYPASLDLDAYAADINIGGSLSLMPSTRGELSLYAGRDVRGSGGVIDLALTQQLPTPDAPGTTGGYAQLRTVNSAAVAHASDAIPVLVSAGRDVSGLSLIAPKAAQISAGRDLLDVGLSVEMTSADTLSSMIAGRDFIASGGINVGGVGQFELIAGRNIDFGSSPGLTSDGNLTDPALPPGGASVLLLAGLGAPLGVVTPSAAGASDFLTKIVAPSSAYEAQLVSYVEQLTGQSGLTSIEAASAIRGLPITQQLPFLQSVLFEELVAAGQEANANPASDFARGYAAIDALFPGSRPTGGQTSPYQGDITMPFSRIYTLQGGAISVLAPGGSLNVGLANPPANLAALGLARTASQLGIVTAQSGDVDIFTQGDVLVNESRVFTLGGGNIAIWSTLGNIDAGRGAKSAISAPPPVIRIDASGNVLIDFSTAVAGSGIRTIQTEPTTPAGNVDLMAPAGFVNAGDAGIGSSGNLNIAAQRVLGLDNIQVAGVSTGVPPEVSGIAASLSGAAAASSSTTSASQGSVQEGAANSKSEAPLAATALNWLDVFIEGFGEEVCKSSDTACLQRQKSTH
jgi:filamentous hemagglutinin family protein